MKAIEKDRARRYETANALPRNRAPPRRRTGPRRPPSASYRLKKYLNKHRALFTTAAVVITSLLTDHGQHLESHRGQPASARLKEAARSEQEQQKTAQDEKLIAKHRIAEEKFASGETALGIADLARLARDDKTNRVAAERLVSAVRENPQPQIAHVFQLPNAPQAVFVTGGSKILIASHSGQVEFLNRDRRASAPPSRREAKNSSPGPT